MSQSSWESDMKRNVRLFRWNIENNVLLGNRYRNGDTRVRLKKQHSFDKSVLGMEILLSNKHFLFYHSKTKILCHLNYSTGTFPKLNDYADDYFSLQKQG